MAAYEVLNTFVTNSANDSLPIVAKLSDVVIERLENTLPMQQQVVSVEDRITLEEIQTSLSSGILVSTWPMIIWTCANTEYSLSYSGSNAKSNLKRIGSCI